MAVAPAHIAECQRRSFLFSIKSLIICDLSSVTIRKERCGMGGNEQNFAAYYFIHSFRSFDVVVGVHFARCRNDNGVDDV